MVIVVVLNKYNLNKDNLQCPILFFQDVDCSFMNKRELEVQVAALKMEIEFLKCIYDEVRICLIDLLTKSSLLLYHEGWHKDHLTARLLHPCGPYLFKSFLSHQSVKHS